MNEIHQIAATNGLIVIEDACYALGSTYFGAKIGCYDKSEWPYLASIPLNISRQVITTNSQGLHDRLRALHTHDILTEKEGQFSSFHLYPILLKDDYVLQKKDIFIGLRDAGIVVQVHYIPVYFHPY